MLLENKVALITGAARGMGRAIAVRFAQEGADLAITDINGPGVEETGIAVKELGRRCVALKADVGDLDDIDRTFGELMSAFGRIDILVNNAGVERNLTFMETTEKDWDLYLRVNAKGQFFGMQRAASQMIKQGDGGRIVNISSITGKGYSGDPNAAYAASKGAVIAMTQSAAQQLGRYSINVNAICPGATRTGMYNGVLAIRAEELGVTLGELEEQLRTSIPIGRVNEPEDIAEMALFLAGPGGRNITGQAFNVDGGLVMR